MIFLVFENRSIKLAFEFLNVQTFACLATNEINFKRLITRFIEFLTQNG